MGIFSERTWESSEIKSKNSDIEHVNCQDIEHENCQRSTVESISHRERVFSIIEHRNSKLQRGNSENEVANILRSSLRILKSSFGNCQDIKRGN